MDNEPKPPPRCDICAERMTVVKDGHVCWPCMNSRPSDKDWRYD